MKIGGRELGLGREKRGRRMNKVSVSTITTGVVSVPRVGGVPVADVLMAKAIEAKEAAQVRIEREVAAVPRRIEEVPGEIGIIMEEPPIEEFIGEGLTSPW